MSQPNYEWWITRDHLWREGDSTPNRADVSGPYGAHHSMLEIVQAGRKFRMRDDDRILVYEGWMAVFGDDSEVTGFEPLDDFGMPDAGCTIIEYLEPTTLRWEPL